ncbi:MAG: HlyD family efflux transporter periplasmic adaptor subunit, partial [Planctomycetota bacterium]
PRRPLDVLAPIEGVVDAVASHAVGEFVEAGTVLYQIIDDRELFVEAKVATRDRAFAVPEVDGSIDSAATSLRFVYATRQVDEDSRLRLTFQLEGDRKFVAGEYVRLRLSLPENTDRLCVPRSAVIDDRGVSVVYVQIHGELFERRVVGLGERDHERIEIVKGVAEGERVVSSGALVVRLASLSGDLPAHHEH